MCSNKKDEVFHCFVVKNFMKSLQRGVVGHKHMNLFNMVSQVFLPRKGTMYHTLHAEMVSFMNSWNILIHIAFMRTTVVAIITFKWLLSLIYCSNMLSQVGLFRKFSIIWALIIYILCKCLGCFCLFLISIFFSKCHEIEIFQRAWLELQVNLDTNMY